MYCDLDKHASISNVEYVLMLITADVVVAVVLLFYIRGKHLRSCRDGQLT